MTNNDLIPCTDELNRLKDFLADFKTEKANVVVGPRYIGAGRFVWIKGGPGNTACGHLKNYGGPYVERP